MNFSFLYLKPEDTDSQSFTDELQLNVDLKEFCMPLKYYENIIFRQQTTKYFYYHPTAFQCLIDFYNNIQSIESDYLSFKRTRNFNKMNKWSVEVSHGSSTILTALSIAVEYCIKIIQAFKDLLSELNKYSFESNDNNALKKFVNEMSGLINRSEFSEIEKILKDINNMSPAICKIEIIITFDELFRANKLGISDFKLRRQDNLSETHFRVNNNAMDQKKYNTIYFCAIKRLLSSVDCLLDSLFSIGRNIGKDMEFYSFSLSILNNGKYDVCFPDYSESESSLFSLRDAVLCMNKDCSTVVANDFHLKEKEIVVITGKNGAGKSVYLRSFCTAQLMFASGLPVFAKSAKMQLYNGLFVAFACEDDLKDDGYGRFEKEASKLSDILQLIKTDSLLVISEIFQSTHFLYGGSALWDIVDTLREKGITMLIISHIDAFITHCVSDCSRIRFIQVMNDHTVKDDSLFIE